MLATASVSVDEYLATTAVVKERHVGHREHSATQHAPLIWVWARQPGQRSQVKPGNYRITDVRVVALLSPKEWIFTSPSYIPIEIFSPDDTITKLQGHFALGVPSVWLINPAIRRAWHIRQTGHWEALEGDLRTVTGDVAMLLAEVFALEEN